MVPFNNFWRICPSVRFNQGVGNGNEVTYLETTKFWGELDGYIVIVIYGYGLGEFHEYFWVGYPKRVVILASV